MTNKGGEFVKKYLPNLNLRRRLLASTSLAAAATALVATMTVALLLSACQNEGGSRGGQDRVVAPSRTVELNAADVQRIRSMTNTSVMQIGQALEELAQEKNCELVAVARALESQLAIRCSDSLCAVTNK